jgi:hypothetical protein
MNTVLGVGPAFMRRRHYHARAAKLAAKFASRPLAQIFLVDRKFVLASVVARSKQGRDGAELACARSTNQINQQSFPSAAQLEARPARSLARSAPAHLPGSCPK